MCPVCPQLYLIHRQLGPVPPCYVRSIFSCSMLMFILNCAQSIASCCLCLSSTVPVPPPAMSSPSQLCTCPFPSVPSPSHLCQFPQATPTVPMSVPPVHPILCPLIPQRCHFHPKLCPVIHNYARFIPNCTYSPAVSSPPPDMPGPHPTTSSRALLMSILNPAQSIACCGHI
jgi:hypothetical protein